MGLLPHLMASRRPGGVEPVSAGTSPTVPTNELAARGDKQKSCCHPGDPHITLVTSTQFRVQWTHILSISLAFGWRMISGAVKMVSAWNRGTFPRIRELKFCKFLSGGGGAKDTGLRVRKTPSTDGKSMGSRVKVCCTPQTCKEGTVWGGLLTPLPTFMHLGRFCQRNQMPTGGK